jgi:hypothetical protein
VLVLAVAAWRLRKRPAQPDPADDGP